MHGGMRKGHESCVALAAWSDTQAQPRTALCRPRPAARLRWPVLLLLLLMPCRLEEGGPRRGRGSRSCSPGPHGGARRPARPPTTCQPPFNRSQTSPPPPRRARAVAAAAAASVAGASVAGSALAGALCRERGRPRRRFSTWRSRYAGPPCSPPRLCMHARVCVSCTAHNLLPPTTPGGRPLTLCGQRAQPRHGGHAAEGPLPAGATAGSCRVADGKRPVPQLSGDERRGRGLRRQRIQPPRASRLAPKRSRGPPLV